MKRRREPAIQAVTQVVITLLVCAMPAVVGACGFHTQASISRALLSWSYPDASHVSGAIWSGQQAGVLDMPDPKRLMATGAERKFLDDAAFAAVMKALYALAEGFKQTPGEGAHASVAVVLLENMLWTRYPAPGVVEPHVSGPRSGDLVVVTEGPYPRESSSEHYPAVTRG